MNVSTLAYPEPICANSAFDMLDSSKLRDLMRCPRYYFFRHVMGWKLDVPEHDTHFGVAVHLAMEHLLLNGLNKDAIVKAIELFNNCYREHFPPETDSEYKTKNPHNFVQLLLQYAERYKDDQVKVLYTEIGGTVPVSDEDELTFRIDAVVERDGKKFVRDFKTSSVGFKWWPKQFRLSAQVGTYLHVAYCLFEQNEVGGFEVDGLLFGANGKNELVRMCETKNPVEMSQWLENVRGWIAQLKREFVKLSEQKTEDDVMVAFPQNESGCLRFNKMCEYWPICSSYTNPLQVRRTPPGFNVEFWHPNEPKTNIGKVKNVEYPKIS